jgi:uncharacterized protein
MEEFMKCPSCKVSLVIAERQGVEIDYCQECRGVWLDRGELDKILERSSSQDRRPSSDRKNDNDNYQYGQKKRKKEGFLSELFDF